MALRLFAADHQPGRRRHLTSAATPLDLTPKRDGLHKAGSPLWQQQAWTFFDQIGEVRYGARYYGNSLSRLRLFVGWRDEDGGPVAPVSPDELPAGLDRAQFEVASAQLERMQGADGSMSELLRAFGVNVFVAGEGYLVGRLDADTGVERWDFLSVDQVVWHDGRWKLKPSPDANLDKLVPLDPEGDVVLRVWLPHPRFASEADSPMRAVLTVCEELLLLSASVRAAALSRIPAGLLLLPDTMLEGGADTYIDGDGTDGESQADRTLADIVQHFVSPIADPNSAAAVAPFVLVGDPADIDKVRLLEPSRAVDVVAAAQRQELLVRLANGVDLPPEVLQGMGASNHWSAWLIDEQSFKAHIAPAAQLFVNGLVEGLLRPALSAAGMVPDSRLVIGFDPADLVSHPDRKANAKDGHASLVISDESYRRALGFGDEDAPDTDEYVRRVALQSGTQGVMPVAAGQITDVVESLRTVAGQVAESTAEGAAEGDAAVADEPSEVESGAPAPVVAAARFDPEFGDFVGKLDRAVFDRLEVAASAAMDRVLDKAGAKLRSRVSRDTEMRAMLSVTKNRDLFAVMGRDAVKAAGVVEEDVVDDGFEELLVLFLLLTGRAQQRVAGRLRDGYGLDGAEYDALVDKQRVDREAGAAAFGAAMTGLALAALYNPKAGAPAVGEFDPSARVPAGVLRDSLRTAGGSPPQAAVGGPTGAPGTAGGSSGGLVAGGDTTRAAAMEVGLVQVGFVWDYGDGLRQTFEPHFLLDGQEFDSWEDPGLANFESWPDGAFYFPGDHDGCMCTERPVYRVQVLGDGEGGDD
jgi:hypothetical protein